MNTASHLVSQIRRKQVLVCAHPAAGGSGEPITLDELTRLLDLSSAECRALVRRLQGRALITLTGGDAGAEEIRLTQRGARLLARMGRAAELPAPARG